MPRPSSRMYDHLDFEASAESSAAPAPARTILFGLMTVSFVVMLYVSRAASLDQL